MEEKQPKQTKENTDHVCKCKYMMNNHMQWFLFCLITVKATSESKSQPSSMLPI